MGGFDLNAKRDAGDVSGTPTPGGTDVYRQNAVRSDHGFSPLDHLSPYCRPLAGITASGRSRATEQFRAMAFAQLTYRESLRDIETCLAAQASNSITWASPPHPAFDPRGRQRAGATGGSVPTSRSDAHRQARTLYAAESIGVELSNTVYALDSTTIDLCLSLFPWAPFRSTKAAVKMHTLLGYPRRHPQLHPHLGRQTARRQRARSADSRTWRVLRHGSRLSGLRTTLRVAPSGWFLRDARQGESGRAARLLGTDRSAPAANYLRSGHRVERVLQPTPLPRSTCAASAFKDADTGRTLVFLTNQTALPALTVCALYKSRWQVELFFKWIKQHLRIKRFYGTSENAVKTKSGSRKSVYVLVAILKKRLHLDASLYTLLQILSVTLFEKMPLQQAFSHDDYTSSTMKRR